MNLNKSFPFLLFLILFLSSCSVNRYIAPPFTDIDKIMDLKVGMTVRQVSDQLRIPPHDIVHAYETGNVILVYNYRVKDRNMAVPARSGGVIIHGEDGQREGEEWYNDNYRELYLLFKDGALKSVFSERSFSEGTQAELADRTLINPDPSSSSFNNDYQLMQGMYEDRASYKERGKLIEDAQLEKRRKSLLVAGGALLALLAIL